jgi:hypothetical protein
MDGNQCNRIITHPEIKKRLKLCIDEAILAAKSPDTLDSFQFADMFPDGKLSSLFLFEIRFYKTWWSGISSGRSAPASPAGPVTTSLG